MAAPGPLLSPKAAARLAKVKPWSIPTKVRDGKGMGGVNTKALSLREVARLPDGERPNCLLVQVPNSVLPSDVLRALKEVRAVDNSFSRRNRVVDLLLTAVTPYPLGAIRTASLHTQYHISVSNSALAQDMHRLLSSRPLFAASSVAAGPPPARPFFGTSTPREYSRVGFTPLDARTWAAGLIDFAERSARKRGGARAQWDQIHVDWAINPFLSGRRVLVRGLPLKRHHGQVREMAAELASDAKDAIVRLPPQQWSDISCWSITCDSVARAHDLARMLNNNYYLESVYGRQFPMRAHVVW